MGLFQNLLPPIVCTLDEMHANFQNQWSRDTEKSAGAHLSGLMEFKFLVGLVIGRRILDYLESVTVLLQKRSSDILLAYNMSNEIKEHIMNISSTMDENNHRHHLSLQKFMREDIYSERNLIKMKLFACSQCGKIFIRRKI